MAIQIEEELHSLFKETNAKYKSKYRSLMFNIKDKNNLTLFRKIADKSLSPFQLVRLSPEELASQELAQWREREARHQLEMIKKTELDAMQLSKTVVMKTHKGEQVVENEDGLKVKVLETSVEIEPVIKTFIPVTPTSESSISKVKDSIEGVKGKHVKKDKKEERHKEGRQRNKSGHRKDHERSRSRHRSRNHSGSRSKSKASKSKERNRSMSFDEENKQKENAEGKPLESNKFVSKTTERSRSRHRRGERERSKSRTHTDRGRSNSKESDRSNSRPRDGSKSKQRERSKSRAKERSKSKDEKECSDKRSKSQTRSRSKSRPRERSRSKSRLVEKSKIQPQKSIPESEDKLVSAVEEKINQSQSVSNKLFEDFNIFSSKPAILDSTIKETVQDFIESEEPVINENLSDQEPSSTVNICTPPFNPLEEEDEELSKPSVWSGTLLMPDVAKFSTSIEEVSGSCGELEFDLPDTLDCVGRISPETAWDYISKMKKSGTKQILVVKFVADNEEDKMSYLSFYSYLSSRSRLGVVGNNSKMIKDFYILPLPSHSPVPQVLLPLDGPGFEDFRPHLLLGIIVRAKRKRISLDKDLPFVPKVPKRSERSYTPPLPEEGSHTPTQQHPDTESFTPPHSPKPPRFIKLKSQTSRASDSPTVSDDYVLEDGDTPYTPEDEGEGDAPYSPGEPASPPCSAELQRKVDQLHRMISDIEEKKQKIDSIVGMSPPQEIITGTAASEEQEELERAPVEVEEVYSPSGSLTPPATDSSYLGRNSSKISLPSDLQEIISSLKKKSEEPKSMDLKSDPIVQAYKSTDEPYSPEDDKYEDDKDEDDKGEDDKDEDDTGEIDEHGELESVAEEKLPTPPPEENASIQSSVKNIKINRDPRQRHTHLSLNQLSDDEVMKKASEMGFMNPENPEPIPDMFKSRNTVGSPAVGTKSGYLFAADEERSQHSSLIQQPPMPAGFMNQTLTSSQPPFTPDFPPPPMPPNFLPNQFQSTHGYPGPPAPPIPPLPPSHVPFTNPQPPPPPPPPSKPIPPPPLSPSESLAINSSKKKKSKKKSRDPRSRKDRKEKRRYSESPPKSYGHDKDKFDKSRDREKHSSKKRERRDSWRNFDDRRDLPEKRREPWEYEQPPQLLPPPPVMHGPPPHAFGMPGPMMGPGPMMIGPPMRGRFPRGMRRGSGRGDFSRPPVRGFHRGGFHLRGHRGSGPPPGSSRNIHSEVDEDIRRFEEQRLKQKILDRKRWENESPPSRKRRMKDDGDSD